MGKLLSIVKISLLIIVLGAIAGAESIADTLRAGKVPLTHFEASELQQPITSYAVFSGNPYLLAYYRNDQSGSLKPPLLIMQYDRDTDHLRRAEIQNINALPQGSARMDCLGSALRIQKHGGAVYIETHGGPSAGCVIRLAPDLSFKSVVPGAILGFVGDRYAILRGNEIHFTSVQPLHIWVMDLTRNVSTTVYPSGDDRLRRKYSGLIRPHIDARWCMENNARCDPETFDAGLAGALAVNDAARAFGFEAVFDAAGFSENSAQVVPRWTVDYVFRERHGTWQYREFEQSRMRVLSGAATLEELVAQKADAAFERRGP